MISALFSILNIQDGRHIVLIMLSDLLKKHENMRYLSRC